MKNRSSRFGSVFHVLRLSAVAAIAGVWTTCRAAEPVFADANDGVQPALRYALDFTGKTLVLNVEIGATTGTDLPPKLTVGLAASRAVLRDVPLKPLPAEPPR